MALFECRQLQDEHFHEYFSRFQDYEFELGAWGYQYSDGEVCSCIINGMNLETRGLADYMSNGRLLYMEPVECWDFFCFMSHQSVQVESYSLMPQPVETFETSLEDMIRNLSVRMNNVIKEHCELCSSNIHSTTSCPFELCERNGGITLESNNHETDTQIQVEEQSTTLDVGYEDDFDARCDFIPIIQVEQNIE